MTIGLYVHLPFCKSKCHYCNFNSFPLREPAQLKDYLQAVITEINHHLSGEVDTVFFGGGTPSLFSPRQIDRLLAAIAETACISTHAEVTLEVNPGTTDKDSLIAYKQAGITRLSLGVQSMNDYRLRQLGRVYNKNDVIEVITQSQQAGLDNVSCDLIYGLPDQKVKEFSKELDELIALGPKHISLYGLSVEEGTQLSKQIEQNQLPRPDEDEAADMYIMSRDKLADEGYIQYELSNFSLKGFNCRHNMKYWTYEPYLGVGLGAHSFIDRVRFWNTADLDTYLEKISTGFSARESQEKLDKAKQLSEFLITGLRKTAGIYFDEMTAVFGNAWKPVIEKVLKNKAIIDLLHHDHRGLRLSGKGMLLSNIVFRELL